MSARIADMQFILMHLGAPVRGRIMSHITGWNIAKFSGGINSPFHIFDFAIRGDKYGEITKANPFDQTVKTEYDLDMYRLYGDGRREKISSEWLVQKLREY